MAATIGATMVFLIARTALGETLSARAGPWLAKLSDGFKEDALSYLLFLRLVPAFPFWFVNIAPAVLGVPLKTYVIGTFFGIIPATFAFASAGAGLDSVVVAAKPEYAACVAEGGGRLQAEDPRQLAGHQGADPGAGAARRGRADPRRPEEMEKEPCSSQMTGPPA